MKRRRRRGSRSDWLFALQHARNARTRRRDLQAPTSFPLSVTPTARDTAQFPRTPTQSNFAEQISHEGNTTEHYAQSSEPHENQEPTTALYAQLRPRREATTGNPDLEPLLGNSCEYGEDDEDSDDEVPEYETERHFQPFQHDEGSLGGMDQLHITTNQQLAVQSFQSLPLQPCAGPHPHGSDTPPFAPLRPLRARELADIEELRRAGDKWKDRLNLSAVVGIVGSVRYTVEQYQYTRDILVEEASGSGPVWPPYSRSLRYFEDILRTSLPESRVVALPKKSVRVVGDEATHGDPDVERTHLYNGGTHDLSETERVRVFFPSAWAKLDVATSVVFDEMFPSTADSGGQRNGLERSRIVQERESITDSCAHLYIEDKGQSLLCGPGTTLEVSAQGSKPRCPTPFRFREATGQYHFKATIASTWCVGAASRPNPSTESALESQSLTSYQRNLITSLSSAPPRPEEPEHILRRVLPGDICALLSTENEIRDCEYSPVIIHRFWRYEEGIPSILVLWMRPYHSNTGDPDGRNLIPRIAETHTVGKLSLLRQDCTALQRPLSSNRGLLADGTPYVVYRILLYCDDFQKSSQSYPNGSAGGCYFLPLTLPPGGRRSSSSVRIISLTPPGVSTNEVLHYIVDDLIQATIYGIDGFTPVGEPVKIFLDVVGFVGDYPASAGAIDVIGHVGRAPCTLCSFRRKHEEETEASKFGYTTSVHAGNPTFLRHAERHISMRSSGISDADANILGMFERSKYTYRNCPLVYLYERLQSERHRIPLTDRGGRVVPGTFDPYRSNAVAPDHLLTGLSKDILNTVFECLPSEQLREEFDVYLCAALRDNGLLPQNEVFNLEKKVLHSMTLSELFCVLLVSVPTLRIITAQYPSGDIISDAFQLLRQLQRLIALTYWWPQSDIDGKQAEHFVHTQRNMYISELKKLSKSYVKAVDDFCKKAEGQKVYLDKPNLHRLIELYEHTIPAFGHVREFMELVFEAAHQPLKRCIARSNNHNAHLFAVEHCVGNDWQGRLSALFRDLSSNDETKKLAARRGLRHLLLGSRADLLDEEQDNAFIKEIDPILERQFTQALQKQLGKDKKVSNFSIPKKSAWKARGRLKLSDLSKSVDTETSLLKQIVQVAKRWINAVYPPLDDERDEEVLSLRLFKYAKRVKLTESDRKVGKPTPFDTVSTNCVVQALVTDETRFHKILESKGGPGTKPVFFVILTLLHRKGDLVWAICLRCSVTNDWIQPTTALDKDSFQILCLTPDVRRVAVYHICQEEGRISTCQIDVNRKLIKHSHTPLQGARMYFQRRINGYPPRLA